MIMIFRKDTSIQQPFNTSPNDVGARGDDRVRSWDFSANRCGCGLLNGSRRRHSDRASVLLYGRPFEPASGRQRNCSVPGLPGRVRRQRQGKAAGARQAESIRLPGSPGGTGSSGCPRLVILRAPACLCLAGSEERSFRARRGCGDRSDRAPASSRETCTQP